MSAQKKKSSSRKSAPKSDRDEPILNPSIPFVPLKVEDDDEPATDCGHHYKEKSEEKSNQAQYQEEAILGY
jgi:hypothetical protein